MAPTNRKGKRFFRWLIFFAIIVIAYITNPDKSTHVEKINDKLYDLLPNSEKTSIIKSIGKVVSNELIENIITVDNYFLFSVSKVEIGNATETIGFGFFGMVIFNEKIKDLDF